MMQELHADRAHALLGASKATQWINCPPSARLQEHIKDQRSGYAEEGEVAHELAEIRLRRHLFICNSKQRKDFDGRLEQIKKSHYYGSEMENAVQVYVDLVEEHFMQAKKQSSEALILLEERLDFSEWVPEGYGTGDVVLISDGVLEVIDLKYGAGVPVSAHNNYQLQLYALGAWSEYNYLYDIHEIRMTIVQPRLDNVSTSSMPLDQLLEWAETVVKPAAQLAYAGEGDFKSGEHCRWCKIKGNCRARADANMAALSYEFQDPAMLSNEEIGSILFIADQLKSWAKDVEDYARGQALSGEKISQWKLVEGRSNRTFTDKARVKLRLMEAGFEESQILKPQELLNLTELETKVVTKKRFNELLSDLVIKPQGKPVLVPETDRRLELNSLEKDFENIDMGEI